MISVDTDIITISDDNDKKLSYEVNEKVLCYHGPLIYEAKILDRDWMDEDPEMTGPYYYVHYKGWKRSWDEWVPESRLLRWSEENIKMQLRLKALYRTKQSPKTQKPGANTSSNDHVEDNTTTSVESNANNSSLGKRRRDAKAEKETDYLNKPEIRLDIPDTLKGQLVDDWENVTKNQQLVTLPRTITINDLLARYKKFKKERKGNRDLNEELLDEVLHGISVYFNKALGSILLYRFERHQYADIKRQFPDKDLTDIYGAEHLLRLFVQLPELVAHTSMDGDAIQALTDYLVDILRFMQKQQKVLFLQEYENAPPNYVAVSGNT
ncbi:MRG-domain-containing protein [Mycotypha africana]|uniref:MRG-domain-containing protein n=1 Tax=Mycotypha africana TaxID=64632 RepID=UPI002301B06D|nr:MRG-domain-containing protein [Mycotypha africana]KAI8984183.1 MRG-domain-containing protein [Mycotypha africana]